MLHRNIRALCKNYEKICKFIDQPAKLSQIIVISETKLKNHSILDISVEKCNFLHAECNSNAGGVGLYIKYNLIGFNLLQISGLFVKQKSLFVTLNIFRTIFS